MSLTNDSNKKLKLFSKIIPVAGFCFFAILLFLRFVFSYHITIQLLASFSITLLMFIIQYFIYRKKGSFFFAPLITSAFILYINIPYYVDEKMSPMFFESILLLVVFLFSFIIFNLYECYGAKKKNYNNVFFISLMTYIVIFLAIDFYRFSIVNYYMTLLPTNAQSFYHTLKGTFFYQATSWEGWKSVFGAHNSPFIILILPIYALIPDTQTLIAVQVLLLSVTSVPIYLLARSRTSNFSACIIAFCFLMLPTIISQHLYPFNVRVVGIPFFAWAVYFFEKNDFKKFLATSILFISAVETFALSFITFSFYALIRKKNKKWVILPIFIGLIWFIMSYYLIMPFFASQGLPPTNNFTKKQFLMYYGHLGENPSEIVKNTLTKPISVVELFLTKERLGFVYIFLSPFIFFLPFFSSVLLLGIPDFFINALSQDPGTISPYPSYNVVISLLLVISVVLGANKIERMLQYFSKRLHYEKIILLIFFLVISQFHIWLKPRDFMPPPEIKTLKEIINNIGEGSKVLVLSLSDGNIESAISDKATIYVIDTAKLIKEPDFVIIGKYYLGDKKNSPQLKRWKKWKKFYKYNPNYNIIIKSDYYELFKRESSEN